MDMIVKSPISELCKLLTNLIEYQKVKLIIFLDEQQLLLLNHFIG